MGGTAVAELVRCDQAAMPSALPPGSHVVDTTIFFAPTSGGVRRYLVAKHDWLKRHTQLRHTILVPGPDDAGDAFGIACFRGPALPGSGGYRLPLRMRAFRDRLARLAPDLIEVGDPYHAAWHAVQAARQQGIPAVAFCHSDVITLAGGFLGGVGQRLAAQYLRQLYGRFDLVLAPSATIANRLDAAGVRNVAIQPLGVDLATLAPGGRDPALRHRLGIRGGTRLLVFAGRLSPEKRVRDLREAMRLLGPRYHLLLVGGTRPARLASNVTLLEYQHDPRALACVLGSCDAFVHAGDQETFGLVAIEAMACGLPVVAARGGALDELVDDAVGATFTPRDPSDLARAVAGVFERDRRALSAAARARAHAYSWDRAFARLLDHYARLLPSRDLSPVR